ncbi:MAG: hypothetical protein WCK55_15555, partial [Verrucomicrobiota bacterium]
MPACWHLLLLCAFAPLRDIPSPDLGLHGQACNSSAFIAPAISVAWVSMAARVTFGRNLLACSRALVEAGET